jgi:DNA-directed RNA polymerase
MLSYIQIQVWISALCNMAAWRHCLNLNEWAPSITYRRQFSVLFMATVSPGDRNRQKCIQTQIHSHRHNFIFIHDINIYMFHPNLSSMTYLKNCTHRSKVSSMRFHFSIKYRSATGFTSREIYAFHSMDGKLKYPSDHLRWHEFQPLCIWQSRNFLINASTLGSTP